MKIFKQTILLFLVILTILVTIDSSNANNLRKIEKVTTTSDKTIELKLNKQTSLINGILESDFKMYKDIKSSKISKDKENAKKIVVDINDSFYKDSSYSILLLAGAEGNIDFRTEEDFINKEIKNLNGDDIQGIDKILITKENQIEIYFLQNLVEKDIELKIYNDIFIDKTLKNSGNINVLLKTQLIKDSQYIATLTFLKDNKGNKISIEDGVYDFKANELKSYDGKFDSVKVNKDNNSNLDIDDGNDDLESKLMDALEGTNLSDTSEEINTERTNTEYDLSSISENNEKEELTQLEKLALDTKETPDSGAETWVLIFGTFIINTFYFLSRRRKNKTAK